MSLDTSETRYEHQRQQLIARYEQETLQSAGRITDDGAVSSSARRSRCYTGRWAREWASMTIDEVQMQAGGRER